MDVTDDSTRIGRFGEERIELISVAFGPGDDDRFDRLELEGGAGDERDEVCRGAGEDPDPPFLKKRSRASETGDGVCAKLGRGGIGPEHGLFIVPTDDDRAGIQQFPNLPRALHRGRQDQHDVPHTSLDCQRMLGFAL